jgi:hypothetical protein
MSREAHDVRGSDGGHHRLPTDAASKEQPGDGGHHLAERVRGAVLEEVRRGFADASLSGLCAEGAIEAAIGYARSLPIERLLDAAGATPPPSTNP